MEFTFGIITAGGADRFIENIVTSIRKQVICPYEIIVVGQSSVTGNDIRNISFDESIKPGWITKKKNIIASLAIYDTLVLMHDYFILDDNWYEGFIKYGTDYEICINKVNNKDGSRFRDYCIFPNFLPQPFNLRFFLPYDFIPSNIMYKLMYISGGYYVIKKALALKFPLDERLGHCDGEDVLFCQQLAIAGIKIKCNSYSTVKLQKLKEPIYSEDSMISEEILDLLNNLDDETIGDMFNKQIYEQNKWLLEDRGINNFNLKQ